MDSCLLCLESGIKTEGSIKVDSVLWETENIKFIIHTHLWPIDTTNTSQGVCNACWIELKTFHKFYVRLKEAQSILTAARESERGRELMQNECDIKTSGLKQENFENHIETDILLEPVLAESEIPLLKGEIDDSFLEELPLEQRRKRGRLPKDATSDLTRNNRDPLQRTNESNHLSRSKKSKLTTTKLNVVLHAALQKNENGTLDANVHTESDSEYDLNEEKQHTETSKKKRKNPDEKTRQEHDKIIAEYFKIFCSICQIPIENFIALRKHFREVHNKRGFVICCKKKIFTRPVLVDHIHFHLDPNFFKCKHCDKVYSDRCTLESHMKIHDVGEQCRNHACDICGKSFVGNTQLETHKLTHAPDYEKKFSCNDCGKFFTTMYSLNYHIQAIHHNKYVKICDICGKTMRCRNSFKLHMEKHDNKLAIPIHCDICGLRLIDRRGLRRHKNSQHPVGGKKEYACQICSKVSPNLRALRTHVRFAHETGPIHKCTMCDKAFKRPEALKEHMATHTGTPLYVCPWCPKTFISNGNMHNHRKKSHPKEWEDAQRQKYAEVFSSNYKPEITPNTNSS